MIHLGFVLQELFNRGINGGSQILACSREAEKPCYLNCEIIPVHGEILFKGNPDGSLIFSRRNEFWTADGGTRGGLRTITGSYGLLGHGKPEWADFLE